MPTAAHIFPEPKKPQNSWVLPFFCQQIAVKATDNLSVLVKVQKECNNPLPLYTNLKDIIKVANSSTQNLENTRITLDWATLIWSTVQICYDRKDTNQPCTRTELGIANI